MSEDMAALFTFSFTYLLLRRLLTISSFVKTSLGNSTSTVSFSLNTLFLISWVSNPFSAKVTALKKAFKLSWKKPSQISGFQIQYSSSKAFKKYKTITVSKSSASKIIKGLKSKATVYVRRRAYKSVKNGKKTTKLYSSWSKTLKTKIK